MVWHIRTRNKKMFGAIYVPDIFLYSEWDLFGVYILIIVPLMLHG